MKKPKRHSAVYGYLEHQLMQRAVRVTKKDPHLSMSGLIGYSLERALPEIEKRLGIDHKGKEVA